jgi:N6-adenosine-specific RNA methylase IME4
MADPPWLFRTRSANGLKKSPQRHYRCMTIEEIAALPVGWLAAPNAVLVLFCTWPLLVGTDPRGAVPGFAHHSPVGVVLDGWGFRYVTAGAWAKRTTNGKTVMGTGYRARSACEPFLIGIKGSPMNSRAERNLIETIETDNVIDGVRREHSAKPEEAYAWCERYLPGARRLDLFSRRDRPGWTAAGDEVGKLNPPKKEAER